MVERHNLSYNNMDRKRSPLQTRGIISANVRLLVIFTLLTLKFVRLNASATSFESRKNQLRSGIRTSRVMSTSLNTNIRVEVDDNPFNDDVKDDPSNEDGHDELQKSRVESSLITDDEGKVSLRTSQLNWQRKASYSDDTVKNTEIYTAQTLWYMFETAPHYWSPLQWCLFVTFVMLFSSLSFCACVVCIIPRCCGQRGTMIYAAML